MIKFLSRKFYETKKIARLEVQTNILNRILDSKMFLL
jgi:hypothetical protein